VAGSIDGALLLGLALGSMAVSRRRNHTNQRPAPVEPASQLSDEGHPNGFPVAAGLGDESIDEGHPNGPAAAAERASESVDEDGQPDGSPAPAESADAGIGPEQIESPSNNHARALVVVAGGFAIEVLEGCGRSPGFLLVGLSVREAESGARIGVRQATVRTLLERGPQLLWQEAVRWQNGRADEAKRARIAEGQRRIEADYADAEPAERLEALTVLFRENTPTPPWQLALRSLAPAALLWLLHRRVKAHLPETIAVQEPKPEPPGAAPRLGLSPAKVRALKIAVRAVRVLEIRRSIRVVRQAYRARRAVKEGAQGAKRARASVVRAWPSRVSLPGRPG
jgi:hypothetical protein